MYKMETAINAIMDTTDIIKIACKHAIKRAFKMFNNETRYSSLQQIVAKLRLTSKHLNNSICDELSLEIMHRWMKGRVRCARVTKRIEQLLQKCDYNGLFRFMDVVSKIFSYHEAVRLLSSFLITITQHHKHILEDYIEFFASRQLHMTMEEYFTDPPSYFSERRDFPFPGFTPQQIEKSLQIANENGWIEESLLLFDHFVTNYFFEEDESQDRVREALENGQKLNFEANLANRMNNQSRHRDYILKHKRTCQNNWLPLYLEVKPITTNNLTDVLHNPMTSYEAKNILHQTHLTQRQKGIISFQGSRLVRYYQSTMRQGNYVQTEYIPNSTTIFTALRVAPENCQTTFPYYFYRAVVENNLETAKKLQTEHNITLERLVTIPSDYLFDKITPLSEYLQYAEPVQRDLVDYLVNNFDGVKQCFSQLERQVSEEMWPIIDYMIELGATINNMRLWKQYFFRKAPRTAREFKMILDVTCKWMYSSILNLLFDTFLDQPFNIRSQIIILLLLAWQYDPTCHLSKLPKELLIMIIEFYDEPPLYIQYARMIMDIATTTIKFATFYDTEKFPPCPRQVLEQTGEIARFVRDYYDKLEDPWSILAVYESERAIKRDAKYLREILQFNSKRSSDPQKFTSSYTVYCYFCKHETDEQALRAFLRHAKRERDFCFLEYAALAGNISFLRVFYEVPANINRLPDAEIYASFARKRKNTMSFEEALALVNQVRNQYLHN